MTLQIETPGIGDNNPPPDAREWVAEDNAQLRREVDALAARANVAPKEIKSPADLDEVGSLVVDARALWKKADKQREADKAPYLKAERDIQTYYSVFLDRLKRISDTFKKLGDAYQAEVARQARLAAAQAAAAARAEEQRRRDDAAFALQAAEEIAHRSAANAAAARALEAADIATAKAADLVRTRTDGGVLATARENWVGEIVDWNALDLNALRPYLKREAAQAALNQAVRMGVRSISGAHIRSETKATFTR